MLRRQMIGTQTTRNSMNDGRFDVNFFIEIKLA